MKTKTIKLVIRKKVDEWLATIDDEEVRQIAAKGTIVTGGCIPSMLLKEKVNDFDLYFKDHRTALTVATYYVDQFKANLEASPDKKAKGIHTAISIDSGTRGIKNELEDEDLLPRRIRIIVKSAGIASEDGTDRPYKYFEGDPDPDAMEASQYVGEVMTDKGQIEDTYDEANAGALEKDTSPPYRPVFLSTNAITLSNQVQLVHRFYGPPKEIHSNYDFVHCTSYWTSWDNELVLHPEALECLLTHELRYTGSKYPLCSLIRIRKFTARGWTINAGQILKMCMQLNELDLKDIKVLEDQLTGVDAAYFREIISKLSKKSTDGRVPTAYLLEIIDRLF